MADDRLKRQSYAFTYSSGTKLPPFIISNRDPMQGHITVKGKLVHFNRVLKDDEEEFHVPYTKYPGTYKSDYIYHLSADGTGVYEAKGKKKGSGGSLTYECTDMEEEETFERKAAGDVTLAQDFLLRRKSYTFTYTSGTKLPPFIISDADPTTGTVVVKGKVVQFTRQIVDGQEEFVVPYTRFPGTYGSDYTYHLRPDGTGIYEKLGHALGSGGSLTYKCTYASGMDWKQAAAVANQLGMDVRNYPRKFAGPHFVDEYRKIGAIHGLYGSLHVEYLGDAFFGTGGNQITQQAPLPLPYFRIDPMGPPTTEEEALKVCEALGLTPGNGELKFADDSYEVKGLYTGKRGPPFRTITGSGDYTHAFFGTGGSYLDMFKKPEDENIFRPTLMWPKSPHGHRLETFESGGEQTCICCETKPPAGSKMSACKESGWEMCQNCVNQLYQLRLAFCQLDANGDGELEFDEIKLLLDAISSSKDSEAALKAVFDQIDVDKSGTIKPDEFLTYMLTGKNEGKPMWKGDGWQEENEAAVEEAHRLEFASKSELHGTKPNEWGTLEYGQIEFARCQGTMTEEARRLLTHPVSKNIKKFEQFAEGVLAKGHTMEVQRTWSVRGGKNPGKDSFMTAVADKDEKDCHIHGPCGYP